MNTIGYFEIQSSDPKRDMEFYQSIFAWKFIKEENMPIEYYRIETNSMNGGLLRRPATVPPVEGGTNAFVCSIQVNNFDATRELILKGWSGGTIKVCSSRQMLARLFCRPGQQYLWNI